jgi:hypothetical protein
MERVDNFQRLDLNRFIGGIFRNRRNWRRGAPVSRYRSISRRRS